MIETISASYLIALGILFVGLESITFSFILFFIGIGLIIVSMISSIYTFDNAIIQIATALVLALLAAFLFRNMILKKISKSKNDREFQVHKSGIGYVENNSIRFEGTYWKTLSDLSSYKEGTPVEILDIINNIVILKEKDN